MPSGYTYRVGEGTEPSFESFVLRCATAFGACVNQRDERLEYPNIALTASSPYYKKEMVRLSEEISRVTQMSDEDFFQELEKGYEEKQKMFLKAVQEEIAQEQRYTEMIKKVKQWTPPTDDHVELKRFMLNQLNESVKFDGPSGYYQQQLAKLQVPTKDNIDLYRKKMLDDLIAAFTRANDSYREDNAREAEHRQWIQNLFDSLNVDVVNDEIIKR